MPPTTQLHHCLHVYRDASIFTCRGKFMFNPDTSFDNWDKKRKKRNWHTLRRFLSQNFFSPITVFETFIKVCNKSDLHIQSFTTMRILLCHLFIKSHYNMSHFPVLAFKNTPHASLPSNGLFYSVVFLKLILLLQLYGLLSCMVHFRK